MAKTLVIELKYMIAPLLFQMHQPCLLENLKVLGDGVERHIKRLGNLCNPRRSPKQSGNDGPADRMRYRTKDAAEVIHGLPQVAFLKVHGGPKSGLVLR